MRVLLPAVLSALLFQASVHAHSVEAADTSAQTSTQAAPSDTVAKSRAPWEPVDTPKKVTEPKPKSNNALYGWGVAVLAAAGMTVFIWRNSRNVS